MGTKKYTSYAEIEQELAVLKLEKEINYNRIKLNFERTKESVVPFQAIAKVGNMYSNFISGPYGTILKIAVPFVIKWFVNKKRGN
ncbi:DUF6327 family protein [Flavobacterium ardleyense]|uniref:DUF6327 family protein n=1 Tax=Flavobacterium ardleyense TaxID=2038737 RepID=A0ABW5Z762_9FLAO